MDEASLKEYIAKKESFLKAKEIKLSAALATGSTAEVALLRREIETRKQNLQKRRAQLAQLITEISGSQTLQGNQSVPDSEEVAGGRLSVSLDSDDYRVLKSIASQHDLSIGWLVRRLLKDSLKRLKSGERIPLDIGFDG